MKTIAQLQTVLGERGEAPAGSGQSLNLSLIGQNVQCQPEFLKISKSEEFLDKKWHFTLEWNEWFYLM